MTIKDIARECGCAIGTVSRVLNNHPDVSEKTREKVLAVVHKHNFILNENAKLLKAQDCKMLKVLVKGTSNILLNSLLERIQKRMEQLPYTASVVVLDEYDNEAKAANRIYYEQKPVGIIFLGGSPDLFKDDFARLLVPCVVISNESHLIEGTRLSSVSTNNFTAACHATEYLIQKGHRKIGVIGGDLCGSGMTQRRYDGFIASLTKAGLEFNYEKAYITSKYSFEDGAASAQRLIEKYPDMTAVFAMSDVMAIGAIRKLSDMGYKVPEDISVTGFDGMSISEYYKPRLTTVRQNTDLLADEGLKILLDNIERNAPPQNKFIPFEFIQGESVRQLP
ncbi:MAG: LacI family DNA-binding transcriptional regulator [Treponema sp.]|nr:LacI family DNA-binding transcriptional regulator [Treponema sp.]